MWTHQKAIEDVLKSKNFDGHQLNPTESEIIFLDKLLRKHQSSWDRFERTGLSSDGVCHEIIDELL